MLVVFPLIFVAVTKTTYGYDSVAPLSSQKYQVVKIYKNVLKI